MKLREGNWKWSRSVLLCPGGHRIFLEDRGPFAAPETCRWAIADNSGSLPQHTDDGVLWIDLAAGVSITLGDASLSKHQPILDTIRGSIPVYREAPGEQSFVALQPAAILRLVSETRCPVRVIGPGAEVLRMIAKLVCDAPALTTLTEFAMAQGKALSREDAERLRALCASEVGRAGKFEGEPLWVPYYYELALLGMADADDDGAWEFTVHAADRRIFPELAKAPTLRIGVDDQGFVTGSLQRPLTER